MSGCATSQLQPPTDPAVCLRPGEEATPTPDVWPIVVNRADVARALERNYAMALRQRGISGRAEVCLLVDETGRLTLTRLLKSSGYPELDSGALAVIGVMEFEPATLGNEPIRVWVVIPVSFSVR